MRALLVTLIPSALVLGLGMQLSSNRAPVASVDVCQVLANLETYRNQEIRVRGEWVQTDHGMSLRDRCRETLQTKEYKWLSAIWLQLPSAEEENPVDFSLDRSALEGAQNEVTRLSRRRRPTPVYATFVGRVQARERLETVVGPGGDVIAVGFGHLNLYPAQLVIRSVDTVSLRK
jgi:hypothetical protein